MRSTQLIIIVLVAGLATATAVRAESSADRLHKGVYQEETVGDLEAAIKIYQEIVADEKANRPHVAQAKYRLGMCYLKKGQNEEAVKTFETLIEEFPGQANLLEQARGRLSTLGHVPESDEAGVQLQDVWAYSGLGELNILAISSDGRYCAFVDDETGGLMVRDLAAEKDQRVAEKAPGISSSTNWQRASISPDNQWVAYIGQDSDSEARYELRIAATDGSGERVLYPNDERSYIRDLGWSADSQHVLATFCDTGGKTGNLNDVPVRIATVSLSDGSTKLLKKLAAEENGGPEPVLSPDGRYVAYARMMDTRSEQEDVFLIPMDGSPEIRLTENPGDDDVLGWTPDGRGLLVRSNRGGSGDDAWLIRLVDGKPVGIPRLVTAGIGADLEGPVRTPTGGWAFYYPDVQRSTKREVFIADFDPDEGRVVGKPKPASEQFPGDTYLWPGWSTDGEYLAYHANSRKPGSVTSRTSPRSLVIRSTETGQERVIELGENRVPGQVAWSPDGRSIMLSSEWEHYAPLNQIDVESGVSTPIGPPALGGRLASSQIIGWSADGKAVYVARNHADAGWEYANGQILRLNLETGQETELYREENDGIFACALSPDREQIAFASPVFDWRSVRVLPTTGGEPRELYSVPAQENISDHVTWSHDGRYLIFWKVRRPKGSGQESLAERILKRESPDSRYELWRIPAEGGEPQKLAWETQAKIHGLRIHPSGKQIAFSTNLSVTKNQIRMMQMVLSPQWAKESCIANLKTIGAAIKRYEHDHGNVPDELSSLYPEYLSQPNLLHCPAHDAWPEQTTTSGIPNDPEMPSSYGYIRGGAHRGLPIAVSPDEDMSKPDILRLRRKYYGELTGLVECWHHHPNWEEYLQFADDGKVYENSYWCYSPQEDQGLLNQLQVAMESNPETWIEDYDMLTLVRMLRSARGKYPARLIEILDANIKAHPGDASASARQALAELRKTRFITCSENDANETYDGQMDLGSPYCDLPGLGRPGNRAVGLRFTDIPVPQGARIRRAYVLFDRCGSYRAEDAGLVFHGELAASAEPFQDVTSNITSRRKTVASVECAPEIWHTHQPKNQTSNLASVIQEIVDQPDWREGNALVLIISGSSKGAPASWDDERGRASPMLYVEVE